MVKIHRMSVLVILAAVAACGSAEQKPIRDEIRLTSLFTVDFDLIDHTGAPATDERFEGKPMIIYFGFTSCPDVCPAALGTLTATLDRLGKDAESIQPLFITVDPKRDNTERLRDHLAYDPRILGLTGDPAALKTAREALKVYAAEVPLPDSAMGYTVDHQRLFYITDASGTPLTAIRDDAAPEDVEALVRRQLRR